MLGALCAFGNYIQQFQLLLYAYISITVQSYLDSKNGIFPIFPNTNLPEVSTFHWLIQIKDTVRELGLGMVLPSS